MIQREHAGGELNPREVISHCCASPSAQCLPVWREQEQSERRGKMTKEKCEPSSAFIKQTTNTREIQSRKYRQ